MSDCIRARLHIEITCKWCRTQRVYDPQDLMVLLGNREVDGLRKRIPCEGCGKRDYMEVLGKHLHPDERQGRSLRRLDSVRIIRRPVWRDEPL